MASISSISTSIFLCTILVVVSANSSSKQNSDNEEIKLQRDLLKDYIPYYRPVKDHKSSVTVKVRFALKYISFDEMEETIKIHSLVTMSWTDEFLNWTPSDYGNINEIQLESHKLWTPKMSLFNADATKDHWDDIYTTCSVMNNGTISCLPQLVHHGICRTLLRHWPYDVQNCTLYFGAWIHTGEQINFTFYDRKPIVLDHYQNGPGWKLLKVLYDRITGSYKSHSYPRLKYTFLLKRETAGPAAIVVIPSILIVMLTLTSLLLDIKNNLRLFLMCFSLFGHFTFLTEIGYSIPKHSPDTPILLLFVRDSMIVTLVAIFVTMILMALTRKIVPAPMWMVKINRLISTSSFKYFIITEFDPINITNVKALMEESLVVGQRSQEINSYVTDWIKFANILNSCMFVISCLVYIVLLISLLTINL